MRTIRKILIGSAIVLAVLLTASVVLARIFEDELTQYVVEGLNQQVRTEIRVEDVSLSFLRKFPNASLEFRDVFFASVPDFQTSVFNGRNTDTLLSAKHLSLQFHVLKLIKREYMIREVQLRKGQLNVYIDRAGNGNYNFWKKTDPSGEKNFLLELADVNLEDIRLSFVNQALETDVQGIIKKCYFRGFFSREEFNLNTGLEGEILHYINHDMLFLSRERISAEANLAVNPLSITISSGKLVLAGQHILVSGEMLRPSPLDLNLSFEGKNLAIETILKFLSASDNKIPENLKSGGSLDFNGSLKGVISNTRLPWINADFSLDQAWLQLPDLPARIYEIRSNGHYTNGIRQGPATSSLQLKDLSLKYGDSRIGGDYSMVNFIEPDFSYHIKTDILLGDLEDIPKIREIIAEINGRLLAEVKMSGGQSLLEDLRKEDFLKYNYNAQLRLEDVSLKFPGLPFELNDFTGEAEFSDHLQISSMSGVFGGSNISISGRADNFLEYFLTPEGNLWMDLDIYSEKLDLNHLRSLSARPDKIRETDSVFLPERLYLKSRFWFDEIDIKNFQASQVTGDLIYKPRRLSINRIELLSMEGRLVSEGMLEQQEDMNFLVRSISDLHSVNISRAFASFDNFGQQFIMDNHLSGKISGEVNFSANLNEGMKIRNESILADCDVMIRDGELRGFEPMLKLSRFIEVEELENIRFSTLENEIFIRNNEIVIPRMDISSSAADITASGLHGFDKEFAYKVKVALSELKSRKSKKLQQQESEFGPIEDDGLGNVYVYLIIEGSPEGTEVRYDRRGAVQNIREQMKDEKSELKKLLNEEFGLFKKDSSLRASDEDKEGQEIIIQWDEAEEDSSSKDTGDNNNSGKEKFIIVWDEDESQEDTLILEPSRKRRKKKR